MRIAFDERYQFAEGYLAKVEVLFLAAETIWELLLCQIADLFKEIVHVFIW